jgi:hypothetical protein
VADVRESVACSRTARLQDAIAPVVEARHPDRDALDLLAMLGKERHGGGGNDALGDNADRRPARQHVDEKSVRTGRCLRRKGVARRAQEQGGRCWQAMERREIEGGWP